MIAIVARHQVAQTAGPSPARIVVGDGRNSISMVGGYSHDHYCPPVVLCRDFCNESRPLRLPSLEGDKTG